MPNGISFGSAEIACPDKIVSRILRYQQDDSADSVFLFWARCVLKVREDVLEKRRRTATEHADAVLPEQADASSLLGTNDVVECCKVMA